MPIVSISSCEWPTLWAALGAFGTAAAVVASFVLWNWSKSSHQYRVLSQFMERYAKPEMSIAVEGLWNYDRVHQANLPEAFQGHLKSRESADPDSPQFKNSPTYWLRPVSQFYMQLAVLYFGNALPTNGIVFRVWSLDDLRIIPEIVIPLEKQRPKIAPETRYDPFTQSLQVLQRFYDVALRAHGLNPPSSPPTGP